MKQHWRQAWSSWRQLEAELACSVWAARGQEVACALPLVNPSLRGAPPAGAVVSTACNPKLFHLPLEGSEPVNGKGPAAVSDALTNVFATGDQDKRVVGEQGGFAGMCRRACINVYACMHVHERIFGGGAGFQAHTHLQKQKSALAVSPHPACHFLPVPKGQTGGWL